MTWWHWALVSIAWTALGVAIVHRWALRVQWLEPVTDRSSHAKPTATAGGMALLFGWLTVTLGYILIDTDVPADFTNSGAGSIALGALVLGGMGLWDDLKPLPILPRLITQLAVTTLVLTTLNAQYPIVFNDGGFLTSVWMMPFWVLCGVWFINLFNFMDGIDGLAASEVVFISTAVMGFALLQADHHWASLWAILLGCSVAFLVWNWSPARIFMGDVGSGFLGFLLITGLWCSVKSGVLEWSTALLLPATFICDATLTLLRRMLRGERWYLSHRQHAYQRLAKRLNSHARVVLLFGLINLLVILPVAWLIETGQITSDGWWLTGVYLLLFGAVWLWGAGTRDSEMTVDGSRH